MKTIRFTDRPGAFTLIELLCVLFIIAVLAAILLPALSQAQAQARRVQCMNHLREVGIAFHAFAHDHNGQFPMAVPGSAGGSLEFVQNGYHTEAEFYFAFRHFQAVSNEMVTPKLVVCPADDRRSAPNFALLKNDNVSYFIGVTAEAGHSTAILAGDRNITNDWTGPATIVRLGPNHALRWTYELHRFKGNLLFADGRVEEKNSPALTAARSQFPTIADLALPTLPPVGGAPRPPAPETWRAAVPPPPASFSGSSSTRTPAVASTGSQVPAAAVSREMPSVASTGVSPTPSSQTANPPDQPSTMPPKTKKPLADTSTGSSPDQAAGGRLTSSPVAMPLAALPSASARGSSWWLWLLLLLGVAAAFVVRRVLGGARRTCPAPANPAGKFTRT